MVKHSVPSDSAPPTPGIIVKMGNNCRTSGGRNTLRLQLQAAGPTSLHLTFCFLESSVVVLSLSIQLGSSSSLCRPLPGGHLCAEDAGLLGGEQGSWAREFCSAGRGAETLLPWERPEASWGRQGLDLDMM